MEAKRPLLKTLIRLSAPFSSYAAAKRPNKNCHQYKTAAKSPKTADSPKTAVPKTGFKTLNRPKTVEWSDDICNSASLIGTVTKPIQRFGTASGGVGAWTSMLVKVPANANRSFRILLKMWDEMAEISLEHIKENDFLHVSGRLESYTRTDENNKSQTFYEIIVKEINYVAECEHSPTSKKAEQLDWGGNNPTSKKAEQLYSGGNNPTGKKSEQLDSGGNNPTSKKAEQLDSGGNNPTSKKAEQFYLGGNNPTSKKAEELDSGGNNPTGKKSEHVDSGGESGIEKYRARLRLWQLFFTNPSLWYDNRSKKAKPSYPDFKHKDTGEALWINDRDPPWVKTQLQLLDSNSSKAKLKRRF